MAHRIFIVLLLSQVVVFGVQTNKLVTGQSVAQTDRLTNVAPGGGGGTIGYVTPTNLLAWFRLDEGGTTNTADSSGNGYDSTLTPIAPTWGLGQVTNALTFTNSGHVQFPNMTDSGGISPNLIGVQDVTLAGFVKWDPTDYCVIVNTVQIINGVRGAELYIDNTGHPTFYMVNDGSTSLVLTNSVALDTNWHHVAGTYESATHTMKLWIDGGMSNSSTAFTFSGYVDAHSSLPSYGIGVNEGGTVFRGSVDEVTIHTRALIASEIAAMAARTNGNSN